MADQISTDGLTVQDIDDLLDEIHAHDNDETLDDSSENSSDEDISNYKQTINVKTYECDYLNNGHIRSLQILNNIISNTVSNHYNIPNWPNSLSSIITDSIAEPSEKYFQSRVNIISQSIVDYIPIENDIMYNTKNENQLHISYIIALYAGHYGWIPNINDGALTYSNHGRRVHFGGTRDIAASIYDEEILHNNDKYLYCEVIVQSKQDEMWIGVSWDFTHLMDGSYAGGASRHNTEEIGYYGGRDSDIYEHWYKAIMKKYSTNASDDNAEDDDEDDHIDGYRSWIYYQKKSKQLFEKYNVSRKTFNMNEYLEECNNNNDSLYLGDSGFGGIHGQNQVLYNKAVEWYETGDVIGVLVNCQKKWVRFYKNGVKQGIDMDLPEDITKLWLCGTCDDTDDCLIIDRKAWQES